ncbi:MAG: hypothetical protein K8U03_20990 [Planctomycetia bacterium]|nr:hypothetical protein [Planctomycetia bacterium]
MESIASESNSAESNFVLETSEPFVGLWSRLISRTNWEKGKIVAQWRERLIAASAAPHDYADETWSRLVGQVTAQHVGRLRRTFTRFGDVYETYAGLYWTHFLAALEWNDAETWLEGASQSGWSVNAMRTQRWEALGGPSETQPQAGEVVAAELDEDAPPAASANEAGRTATEIRDPSEFDADAHSGPSHEGPDFGDEEGADDAEYAETGSGDAPFDLPSPQRPFEKLPSLPDDLREAFEAYKLAILHHKLKEWSDVSPDDVVASLRALEQLAVAPS